MAFLLAVILAVIPLIIAPSALFYFDVTPKAAVALWGAAAVLPWAAAGRLRSLRSTRHGRWFCILLAVTALCAALSTAFSVRPQLSLVGTNWRRFGLVGQLAVFTLAAGAGEAAARGGARTMLRATALTGLPIALYGILQYFGWDPWLPSRAYHVGEGVWTIVRPPGTLGHAAYFANWLLFAVFAGVWLRLTERAAGWRMAGSAAACAAALAIVLSGTRAGLAGLATGGLLLWFWLRPRVSRRAVTAVAGVAVAFVLFYYSPAGERLRGRTRWYIEDTWGGARLRMWRDSLAMAVHRPAFGSGPETFSLVFPRYESKDLAAAYPDFYHESPHNVFLDALTAEGLPAMAAFAALCALALITAWRCRHQEPRATGALAAAIAAALVAHQFSVFTIPTALAFYVALALTAATGAKRVPAPLSRIAMAAAAPVAAALALCGVWLTAADRRQFDIQAALHEGRFADALYGGAHPTPPFDDLWYSRALAAAGSQTPDPLLAARARQEALDAGLRATRTGENPQNAWYHVATLRAAVNDFAGTERSLHEAIAAAPNWFKPHWTLARLLSMAGRTNEARTEAAAAAQLNRKDPEVARTLAEIRRK